MKILKKALLLFLAVLLIFTVSVQASDSAKKFDDDSFFIYMGTYGEEHWPLFEYYYYSTDLSGTNFKHRKTYYKGGLDVEPEYGDMFRTNSEIVTEKDPTTLSTYELAADIKLLRMGNCSYLLDKKDLTVKTNSYDGHPMEPHFSIFTLILDDGTGEDKYYSQDYFASDVEIMLGTAESGDKILFAYYKDSAILPLEPPHHADKARTEEAETSTENDTVFNTVLSIINDLFTYIQLI